MLRLPKEINTATFNSHFRPHKGFENKAHGIGILLIQLWLNDKGILVPITGWLDAETIQGIRLLQKQLNIQEEFIFGPETQEATHDEFLEWLNQFPLNSLMYGITLNTDPSHSHEAY